MKGRIAENGMAVALLAGIVLLVLGLIDAQANGLTDGHERPGATYDILKIDPPSAEACAQACQDDPNCKAFSYVKPGFQGKKARCWLKDRVTPTWSSECCQSGVKTYDSAEGLETFTNISLTAPDGTPMGMDLCREAGHDCGWPAAHAYCAEQGFAKAVDFHVQRETPPTLTPVDGRPCVGRFCHRMASVTCTNSPQETADAVQ